jgi:hypothetical protein
MKAEFSLVLDDILTRTLAAKWDSRNMEECGEVIPLSTFNNSIPFRNSDTSIFDSLVPQFELFTDANLESLRKPLDSGLIMNNITEAHHENDFMWVKVRQVDPRKIKGLHLPTKIALSTTSAFVDDKTGIVECTKRYHTFRDGLWVDLPVKYKFTKFKNNGRYEDHIVWVKNNSTPEQTHKFITCAIAWQLSMEYQWSVIAGFENSPTVSFPTSASGIRELLKFRDLTNGERRRKSLIHWVREHSRRISKPDHSEDGLILIHEHLRGTTKATIDGFTIGITPSLFDLDRARIAKEKSQKFHYRAASSSISGSA